MLKTDNVLLSIIVLCYNQEHYITQTLDSIVNQDSDFNFELIVADDCSSDGTRAIIESYYNKYPTVIRKVFNKNNLGVVANYFNAVGLCSGKYIMCCGGDDYWLPNKVSRQIRYLEHNPDVGMLCGYARFYNENLHSFENKLYGLPNVSYENLILENPICAATVCYRRELILDYIEKVKPLERGWLLEDYPMWLWFSLKSKIVFDEHIYAIYRRVSGSITHQKDISKKLNFQRSVSEVSWFFANNDKTKAAVKDCYYKNIADIMYNYGLFDESLYFFKKCNVKKQEFLTCIKYLSAYIPGVRVICRHLYLKTFKDILM